MSSTAAASYQFHGSGNSTHSLQSNYNETRNCTERLNMACDSTSGRRCVIDLRFDYWHRIFDRQPVKYFIGYITGHILSPVKRAQSWPVKQPSLWSPDIWPVTALNSLSQYVGLQAPNGAHRYRLKPCPCGGTQGHGGKDGGSGATDDLNLNKYGITDPPISQLSPQV